LLMAVGGGGGAVAGSLITGKQIKDGTVTSADIKNGTVTNRDLAKSARSKAGQTGSQGPAGAPGPAGAAGARGDRGLSAWDTIPSGTTVSGAVLDQQFLGAGYTGAGVAYKSVELPARVSKLLSFSTIRIAPGSPGANPTRVDDRCSGSAADPTAPGGRGRPLPCHPNRSSRPSRSTRRRSRPPRPPRRRGGWSDSVVVHHDRPRPARVDRLEAGADGAFVSCAVDPEVGTVFGLEL